MKITKGTAAAGLAAVTIAGAGLALTSHSALALAQTNDSLAGKIATKFNLNQDEVQAVIDEEHEAKAAEFQQKYEERLSQAVTDGKLTSEQKDQILTKMGEVKTRMEALKSETNDSTRRDEMKNLHDELKQWAKDNDIPKQYVMPVGGGHGHGGRGLMGRPGDTPSQSDNTLGSSSQDKTAAN